MHAGPQGRSVPSRARQTRRRRGFRKRRISLWSGERDQPCARPLNRAGQHLDFFGFRRPPCSPLRARLPSVSGLPDRLDSIPPGVASCTIANDIRGRHGFRKSGAEGARPPPAMLPPGRLHVGCPPRSGSYTCAPSMGAGWSSENRWAAGHAARTAWAFARAIKTRMRENAFETSFGETIPRKNLNNFSGSPGATRPAVLRARS